MANRPLWTQIQSVPLGATRSPAQLFYIVVISIMVIETVIMVLFEYLPQLPPLEESLADGALLSIMFHWLFDSLICYRFKGADGSR